MIWATVRSRSCFCWLYSVSPSSAAKNVLNLILVSTIWWCPCVELSLVLLEAMSSVFSWNNSVSLCPASFFTPGPNLLVLPGISWLLTFASSPLWWKGHLFLGLVLEGLVGHHRTLFGISGWGIDLDYCDWMVWFGNEQRSFCHFWDCT